ncbi:MAG: PAS domain S-box protein, partial [Chitinophagaceae bacterium]
MQQPFSHIAINKEQLNRLFPFHICLNQQMQIENVGISMAKLLPIPLNANFTSIFTVARPQLNTVDFNTLIAWQNNIVILKPANENRQLKFKGQFEYLDAGNCLLFVGSPWFNSIDELAENQLSFADFAGYDTVIDMLHILKEQEIANADIKKLLTKLNHQSSELKKLSLIVEETTHGITITNPFGEVEWANKAFEKISGYSLNEIKGKKPGILLQGPKTNDHTKAYLRYQIKHKLPFYCEILNYHKNGTTYWTRISGQPIFNKKGELTNFFAIQENISEKFESDKKIEAQRVFYEDVLNAIPADIAVFSPKHEYLFVNPVAISSANVREWIIGKRDEDFCVYRNKPLSLAENRRKLFNKVIETKQQIEWEDKVIKPNGQEAYILRKLYPVVNADGDVSLVIGYGLDITERKKAEQQILVSEKRYRDLFNFSQALICTHDLTGKVLTVNPAICETLGYTEDELIGAHIQKVLTPEGKTQFQSEYLDKVIANKKHKGVFVVLCKSGKKIYLLYQNFLMNEDNEKAYIIGFSQDITERINAENELNKAKIAAEEAGKAKQIFLANMSHEIRTPMTGIMGIAELLSKTQQTPTQQEYTKLIIESTHTLLHLMNDVLDLAKIESGKFDLEEIPFCLYEKVEQVIKTFTFKANDKSLYLHFNTNLNKKFTVIGDPHRLGQILNNLINNAIKFTADGGITVNVFAHNKNNQQTVIECSIIDTGIGISNENQTKIFEAFVQASADTTRKFGGTGLGLSICKQLIDLQGGTIAVESEPQKGSTFRFTIPYAIADYTQINQSINLEHASQNIPPLHILVAEDVQINQMIARNILEGWGHSVDIAVNGKEAVYKAEQNTYDLILMDVHMPDMDGLT